MNYVTLQQINKDGKVINTIVYSTIYSAMIIYRIEK